MKTLFNATAQTKILVKTLFLFSLTISSLVAPKALADTNQIFVQASKGSFNDAAISKLFTNKPELKAEVIFAGTPTNTFKLADENKTLAFSAVENSTIEGKLVQATVDALKLYKITQVNAFTTIPIEMCVLMTESDVKQHKAISAIASHPAALKQINMWKHSLNATELPVPEGTSAAAAKVSQGELPSGTAAIGACVLSTVYPNLIIVEKGVQDNKDNKTSFLLVNVEKRRTPIGENEARQELAKAIKQGKQL
ncbi:hypothetical protein GCM10007938_29780 [Vibrio zhanjiangensis]|uniref:prephenate dehydratase n=1 Tax=Vibrio zhanjiangensis TaxID=1046128 RepID=A0ABQ6F2N8_9VIBR|nr:prephenate dehydratase domain-containing protein [Vibrio zhanjiangensis]GLT19196.1 hypothetical protein GCM10007938_29780 [Vibrio zhanjiangensis]